MSNLKIFLSSTCYDLSHAREVLKGHIESLGHTSILSDFGDILYDPRVHTHTSCVQSIDETDIFVVLIGGRFGGESIPEVHDLLSLEEVNKQSRNNDFINLGKISITQAEVIKAIEKKIPIYVLVDKDVYSDYHTYTLSKRENGKDFASSVSYGSIDKQEYNKYIFEFIDFLVKRNLNNAIETYSSTEDIKNYLSNQWSKYFSQLLREKKEEKSRQKQESGEVCINDKQRYEILNEYKPNSYIPLKDNFCDLANSSSCETSIYPNILVMGEYVERIHFAQKGYEFNGKNMLSVHYKENLPSEREERSFMFAINLTQLPVENKPVFFFSYGQRVSHKCGDGVNNHDKSFGLFYGEPAPEDDNDEINEDHKGMGIRLFFYCEKCKKDRISENCDTKVITKDIQLNEWILFSVTYSNNALKLYMDDKLIFDEVFILKTSMTPYLNLGGFVHHNEQGAMIVKDLDYTMKGYLREFMVFKNRCLTEDEIFDLNNKIKKLL